MARKQNRRVNSRSERIVEQYVVDGNTIRKIQAIPQEEPERKPDNFQKSGKNQSDEPRLCNVSGSGISGSSVYVCPLSADEVCDHDTDKGDCHCRVRAESAESRE